ncbi:hypothetical protein SELMODRAFT_129332 [Selaginella moellendorffii]|uniref:UBX domain-containing protein n=1 Tax=Selaginella moellendorffii TaxID=88036 RepID=D8T0T2_SELML|nr:hypothetical protein SELMODRAFT_129332 [Selaginella moellendorffii]
MGDKKKKRGEVATLSDLKRAQESDSDSDGQEYYTGGEKSGMVVQDPANNKQNKDVDSIFNRALELGAQKGTGDVSSSSSRAKSGGFGGVGRTLAGGQTSAAAAPDEDSTPEPVFHTITFWRNGFTVNDGGLRRLDDPANIPFLQVREIEFLSIHRGECPRELDSRNPDIPVHVNLMKRDADWTPPPPAQQQYFFGAGRTLGSSQPPSSNDASDAAVTPAAPFRGIVVDEQKPFTSLQLRLADGTRMVARFNNHHTVGDIRGFIDAARAGGPKLYSLQVMGFPPKLLNDSSLTIQEAGLANAVIIQKSNA